jgi:hypothetical protein
MKPQLRQTFRSIDLANPRLRRVRRGRAVDYKVTSKSFNFAAKRRLPFQFVSASDGTNVVCMTRRARWVTTLRARWVKGLAG